MEPFCQHPFKCVPFLTLLEPSSVPDTGQMGAQKAATQFSCLEDIRLILTFFFLFVKKFCFSVSYFCLKLEDVKL